MSNHPTVDNSQLRREAANAITNYMHHELFEITGDTRMLPWMEEQGVQFMEMIDRAIAKTKESPLAQEVLKMRGVKP